MIPVQPTLNIKYFKFKKNSSPSGLRCLFYLSWEDALWDLLIDKNVKKKSVILLPDYYCIDVEENIKKHGYKVIHYKILNNLETDKKSFENAIHKYKPDVIIVFHPVGIKSNLFVNTKWLIKVIGNSILIEDSVHRILSVNDLNVLKKNHYIIDSLRKVVPIQGARLYGNKNDLDFDVPGVFQSLAYRIKVDLYWLLMIIYWTLGLGKLAEMVMTKGYEIIGNSIDPSRGSFFCRVLSNYIDVKKIQSVKIKQVNYYKKNLDKTLPFKLKIRKTDYKHLRGYPVILPLRNANKILNYLRSHKLLLRFELDGCRWSKKQKIVYLPLGLHLSKNSQDSVCYLVNKAIQKV